AELGARWTAGFTPASCVPAGDGGAWAPDVAVPWPGEGSEIERCLALTDALGAPRRGLALDFPLRARDHEQARALLAGCGLRGPYAIVHPGAQWASRRWPVERFAAVAD